MCKVYVQKEYKYRWQVAQSDNHWIVPPPTPFQMVKYNYIWVCIVFDLGYGENEHTNITGERFIGNHFPFLSILRKAHDVTVQEFI